MFNFKLQMKCRGRVDTFEKFTVQDNSIQSTAGMFQEHAICKTVTSFAAAL